MARRICTTLLTQLAQAARCPAGQTAAWTSRAKVLDAAVSHQATCLKAVAASWDSAAHTFAARSFTTSGSVQSNLLNVLKEEIKVENENYAKPSEIASGPPAPFTLTETPDDTLLTLKRTYNGEDIAVDLHVNNQPAQEYGDENTNEEGETLSMVAFNVTVTKKGASLVFECESDGTFVTVTHLSHEPKDGHSSESFYTGPVFGELDEVLQQELRQYLHDRGITEELGEYLRHLIYDKEQREYVSWLKKVQDFVSA